MAGKLVEAEKLRGQAAAAARLAASEEKTLAKLNAEKELAQKERQAAQARAQELETRIREARPITQVTQSPPPDKNIELPSASASSARERLRSPQYEKRACIRSA